MRTKSYGKNSQIFVMKLKKNITVNNDRKHYTKIKFNSDNELLLLNMPIQFYEMAIVIGFVNKGSELCPQFYLVETLGIKCKNKI